jgi:co-chaperonin GroES (HSP10)
MGLVVQNNYLLLQAVRSGSSQFQTEDNNENKYKVAAVSKEIASIKINDVIFLSPGFYEKTTIDGTEYTIANNEDVLAVENVA